MIEVQGQVNLSITGMNRIKLTGYYLHLLNIQAGKIQTLKLNKVIIGNK